MISPYSPKDPSDKYPEMREKCLKMKEITYLLKNEPTCQVSGRINLVFISELVFESK